MPNYYHPSDTRELVRSNSQIDNFFLRYRYFLEEDSRLRYKLNLQRSSYKLEDSSKDLLKMLIDRQTEQLLQFAKQNVKLYCVDATVDWRLIIGLGGEHVLETNMTLHHIYGIPYIPGSAVKGVLRHWWFQELQEEKEFINDKGEVDEDEAMKDSDYLVYLKTFGSQKQRGRVKFLDAYPDEVQFATDIMNPHYPDYYSGTKPPTDHQNPIPIKFLTVEKTTFRFVFMGKDQTHLDVLKSRFQDALEIKGVGAKTAVGYGYFRDFKDQTDVITEELNRQQKAVEEEREAKRIESLSPIEQLAEELNRLSEKQVDEQRVTQIFDDELPSLEGDDKQLIAQALKDYWQRINKWEGGSDKQRRKVMVVKIILEES